MPFFGKHLDDSELIMIANERQLGAGSPTGTEGLLISSQELQEWHRKKKQRMTRNRNKSGITHKMFDRTAKEGQINNGRFSIDVDSSGNESHGGGGLKGQKTVVKESSGMKKRRATMLLTKPMPLHEAYEKGVLVDPTAIKQQLKKDTDSPKEVNAFKLKTATVSNLDRGSLGE